MAVSKRLRYEVLRRDNNTCRYCGRSAPEVRLTVDHVLPVALGGRDEAENLVACCSDCNSGKTSTTPDAPLIADVKQDALRWSAAMHVAIEQASGDLQAQLAYRERFLKAWQAWEATYGGSSKPLPLEEGWEGSVENFRARGLPLEMLLEDVRKAMAASHVKPDNTFRYLCGIAWKEIEKIEAAARAAFGGAIRAGEAPSLEERTTAAVIEAAVLVWRTQWSQAQGADPDEDAELEVRDHAVELYPAEISASQLLAAAEFAADLDSSALPDYVDGNEEPLEVRVAHALTYGWAARHETAPTPAQFTEVMIQVLTAEMVGYHPDSTLIAVRRAAETGDDLNVFAAFHTIKRALDEYGESATVQALEHSLTQEQLNGYTSVSIAARAAARKAREMREAAGDSANWWDA